MAASTSCCATICSGGIPTNKRPRAGASLPMADRFRGSSRYKPPGEASLCAAGLFRLPSLAPAGEGGGFRPALPARPPNPCAGRRDTARASFFRKGEGAPGPPQSSGIPAGKAKGRAGRTPRRFRACAPSPRARPPRGPFPSQHGESKSIFRGNSLRNPLAHAHCLMYIAAILHFSWSCHEQKRTGQGSGGSGQHFSG